MRFTPKNAASSLLIQTPSRIEKRKTYQGYFSGLENESPIRWEEFELLYQRPLRRRL